MRYRNENIRQKWSRRLQEALAEPAAPAVGLPDEAWAVPPAPAAEEPAALWRAPTHDYAEDARRLEEELRRQQDRVAEAREAQRRAEAALAELRAQHSAAEERIRSMAAALEDARSRTMAQDPALAEAVHRLEKERDEARRSLAEKEGEAATLQEDLAQARSGASEAFARELKKRDEELQALRAKLGASEADNAADLEKRLAEREAAFRKDWQEQEQAQEALRKSLRQKETELKLLAENTNRLSQQNKELVAKLQAFKDAPPAAAEAAVAAPDPSLQEKIGALEVALEGRDRMLADQEKAMEAQRVRIEQLSLETKGMQESKTLVQNLTFRVQALMQEKDKLEQALKSGPSQADKDKQEALAKAREKELEDLKKAVAAAEADKKALAERTIPAAQAAPPEELTALRKQVEDMRRKNEELAARSVSPPAADAAALQKQIAELKAKNEDLETQVRLVVMNSEAIERMEKSLRESLRTMSLTPAVPPAAARRSFAELVRGPGLFARLWSWWRAPLLRISRKKPAAAPPASAPAPGGVPPGVERLRQMRQKR